MKLRHIPRGIVTSLRKGDDARKERFRLWFLNHAQGRHAQAWLAFFSFTESIFFPIPVDPLLIAVLIADTTRWVYFALLTTIASVAGGIVAYLLGLFVFDVVGERIILFYNLSGAFEEVRVLFGQNAFWTLIAAAFLPIPYKVFTLAAGFFKIHFVTFIIASVVGRSLRFLGVSFLVYLYGGVVARFVYRSLNSVTLIILTIVVIALIIWGLL